MNCRSAQRRLTSEQTGDRARLEAHLAECGDCSRLAARLDLARQALEEHHTDVTPNGAFAARVLSDLPQPSPILGWAAVRLLPAAAALLLVLSAWAWLAAPVVSELSDTSPTDDLVSWVLESGEEIE